MSTSLDFEHWLRFTVPWQLSVSPSKQVAMETKLDQFAGHVRALERKAPAEFQAFFSALRTRMEEVHKWKSPKGTVVSPIITNGQPETFPNGKLRYRLVEKSMKR